MSTNLNISFNSRIFISGNIRALTGLHIGGNSTEMSIGGADTIVVRDPLTNYPYIPGSSLRGKMRSLFERMRGEMTLKLRNPSSTVTSLEELGEKMAKGSELNSAEPASNPEHMASCLFGVSIDKQSTEHFVPQRLVVRDAKLTNADYLEQAKNTDMPLTEVKTEVAIDRVTSKANPRQIERVPAGAEFSFDMVLNLYGDDNEKDYLGYVFQCMELLQDDYLGGHGSRGYGRIEFKDLKLKQKTLRDYQNNSSGQDMDLSLLPESLQS